jgi:hypothetical protein
MPRAGWLLGHLISDAICCTIQVLVRHCTVLHVGVAVVVTDALVAAACSATEQIQREDIDDVENVGPRLRKLARQLFASEPFAKLLYLLTGLHVDGVRSLIRRFRCGLDYTVGCHADVVDQCRLDATLCFVDDADEDEVWESGEAGAYQCYLHIDQSNHYSAEAEVYTRFVVTTALIDDGKDVQTA